MADSAIQRDRPPKGTWHHGWFLSAFALGIGALAIGRLVSSPRSGWLLALAIVLAVESGLAGRRWWHRTPFDISDRMPRRLSTRAHLSWYQRPFVGWAVGYFDQPRWALGAHEDSVGVVGPPRENKTAGSGIAQLLIWGGPAISVAPKRELFRATAMRRRQVAQEHGGQILIYAPTEEGRVEGLVPIRFSPAGSTDPNVAKLRVSSWIEAATTAKHVENADHWRTGAGCILRGTFLACAHHRQRSGDFSLVRAWLSRRNLEEPIQILRDLGRLPPISGRTSWSV